MTPSLPTALGHRVATARLRNDRTTIWWLFAIALVIFALGVSLIEVWALFWRPKPGPVPYFGDLDIYRSAVVYWLHGGDLYAFVYPYPTIQQLGFTYPPFAAFAFLPMARVPMSILAPVWTAGTFMLVGILGLVVAEHARTANHWGARRVRDPRFVFVGGLTWAVLLLSYPVFNNLGVGQISLAITTFTLLDAMGVVSQRFQGVLTGLMAAIKLTPLVFIAYFVVTGQRRQALLTSGAFVAATAVSFALAPHESIAYWGNDVLETSRVGRTSWVRNKSLMGLLARWGAEGHTLVALWLALGLGISFVALLRARQSFDRGMTLEASLIIGSLSVVVSPISWPHHQTWAVLVGVLLLLARGHMKTVAGIAVLAIFWLASPFSGLTEPQSLAMRLGNEFPTLAFIVICTLGLRGAASTSTRSSGTTEPAEVDPSTARTT